MKKRIAILQSNYIPWKGYFDLIAAVDEFILFDNVQFTRQDWRNRNQIKTPQGTQWLTVPVGENIRRRICDVQISNVKWQLKHWKSLAGNYQKAQYFKEIQLWLEPLYLAKNYTHLSHLNRTFIEAICRYLGIETLITSSSDYSLLNGRTERLVDLCRQAGATEYISGPSAKGYINEALFKDAGISLIWFDYVGYPKYPQLWGEFNHEVTILDLLFNCGRDSLRYMRYV